jgi:WD40 repeat protein
MSQRFWRIAFSLNSELPVSGSSDGIVRIWNSETRKTKRDLQSGSSFVRDVAFFPDGQLLASAGASSIRLWNPDTGEQKYKFDFNLTVTDVCFSYGSQEVRMENEILHLPSANSPSRDVILVKGAWITINGQHVLWLPPSMFNFEGNLLAIEQFSGFVNCMEFRGEWRTGKCRW